MKRSLVAAAALMAVVGAVHAQSSVTLYGIVDAAVRYSDNEGVSKSNLTRLVGGGMSQSRWGMNINEDLGSGLRALANMEQRFTSDDGALANVAQWSQVWVGLQSASFGRVTLGRQYNVLFDMTTTTYSSFKFSPYIEHMKPETVWMGNGGTNASATATNLYARVNNSVKYTLAVGGLVAQAQVSAGEGDAALAKSYGASIKYNFGLIAVGGGYIQQEAIGGQKSDVYTVGGALTTGPFYANLSYWKNEYDAGYPLSQIPSLVVGTGLTVPVATNSFTAQTGEREMVMGGMTYNITPALLVGGQYWTFKQQTLAGVSNGKFDALAVLADYAFSKRTDAYAVVDYTKLKDGYVLNGTFASAATAAATGAKDRTSVTVGVRHRF